MLIISETFLNLPEYFFFLQGVDMSMMFGYAWGCYCLGFTKVLIRFVFMIVLFLFFFFHEKICCGYSL